MNLCQALRVNAEELVRAFGIPFAVIAGLGSPFLLAGLMVSACSGSPPPDPKPAIDFGQQLAVALCKAEAPRGGFDPELCQVGSDFLRPFVEDAADRVVAASLEPASFVGAAGVRSVPCAPLEDKPAQFPPGAPSGGAGGQ